VGRSVGCLASLFLVGRLFDWLVGLSVSQLIVWLVVWLFGWSIDCLVG